MLVRVSDAAAREIREQNLDERLSCLMRDVETMGKAALWSRAYQKRPPFYVFRWGNCRAFARAYELPEGDALFVARLVRRGDDEGYADLWTAVENSDRDNTLDAPSAEDMKRWVAHEAETREELPSTSSTPIPVDYQGWLLPPACFQDEEFTILESERWVTAFKDRGISNFWQSYRALVELASSDDHPGQRLQSLPSVRLLSDAHGRGIIYSVAIPADSPDRTVLFLLAPVPRPQGKTLAESELERLATSALPPAGDGSEGSYRLDDLASVAWRAYPGYLVADENIWLQIELNVEANLALSAEEELLLSRICTPQPGGTTLPVFINGRAGSGKSTMLLYLLADSWRRRSISPETMRGAPIFLTYNQRLVEAARSATRTLLTVHAPSLVENVTIPSGFDDLFRSFRDFAQSLLPPDVQTRFSNETYVDFPRFRRLYAGEATRDEASAACLLPQRKMFSPGLCWHVLRTFIKGYSPDGHLTPELYEDIPRDDRTVSTAAYRQIHDTIWHSWYQDVTSEKGFWDDQDLVRAVIEAGAWGDGYPAVFCDESQDFTRLDLQLLLRVSVYSRYDLGGHPILCLPFAFAGDPFQTVNPTGFRWESTRAAFHDELIVPLDPYQHRSLHLNLEELEHNYRSTRKIVQVANLIQLWRRLLSERYQATPQQPWRTLAAVSPQVFVLGDGLGPDEFAALAQSTIIVTPAEENEERAFVSQDPALSKVASQSGFGKNVFSAASAKGLEFDRVIVYRFGDYAPPDLWETPDSDEDKSLMAEYFLNKLYVAATRARKLLFIVDTPEGYERLWSHASPAEVERLSSRIDDWETWREMVTPVPLGRDKEEIQEREPLAIAEELRDKGEKTGSADLLRRAAGFYREAGSDWETTARRCEAMADHFDRRYEAAGCAYLALGAADDAWQAFWDGACWGNLAKFYSDFPKHRPTHEGQSLATFMTSAPSDTAALVAFTEFLLDMQARQKPLLAKSTQWRQVDEQYCQRLTSLASGEIDPGSWRRAAAAVRYLSENGHSVPTGLAAICLVNAGDFAEAAEAFEIEGATDRDDYRRAKAAAVGLPSGLAWLARLSVGPDEAVLHAWEDRGGFSGGFADPQWLRFVAPAYQQRRRHWEAFRAYLRWEGRLDDAIACFERGVRGISPADARKGLRDLVTELLRTGDPYRAVEVVERHSRSVRLSDEQSVRLACEVIRYIAGHQVDPTVVSRAKLEEFILAILEKPRARWGKHLSAIEAGAAMERLGAINSSLRLYDRLDEIAASPDERRKLRERWLVCKQRQIDYARDTSQQAPEAIAQMIRDRREQASRWGLSAEEGRPEFPDLSGATVVPPVIQGVPASAVSEIAQGILRFTADGLEVTCNGPRRRVLITDADSLRSLTIDIGSRRVDGNLLESAPDEKEGSQRVSLPDKGSVDIVTEGSRDIVRLRLTTGTAEVVFRRQMAR